MLATKWPRRQKENLGIGEESELDSKLSHSIPICNNHKATGSSWLFLLRLYSVLGMYSCHLIYFPLCNNPIP